jgi:UDP-glucose:(heptosyl)LPS alpha-1,3-glucosyltransferase
VRQDIAVCYNRRDRAEVVYHGVDVELFHPNPRDLIRGRVRQELGLGEDDFAFLVVGDLRKGAEVAIEALNQTPGARLVLVSRTCPDAYRRKAEEAGVGNRVHFRGPTDAIQAYYAAADALAFPTPYDAFGMVISEAMASGLPVITTREAGAAELIDDGRNALLMSDPSDAGQLAALMSRLMVDRSLCQSLGSQAREGIQSRTWDNAADQTMKVYERALAERRT